ncbi:MAG: 4Fe-4S binding protein, partial [Thermoplasmata archaeon]|nr:4Fe-4S binding protein [Thermoplasmata archaeon]
AARLLTVLGPSEQIGEVISVDGGVIEAHLDGTVVVHADEKRAAKDLVEKARQLVVRSELCVGCAVCVPRCPTGALSIKDMRVILDVEGCIQCGSCFGPCAVVDFPPVVVDIDVH